MTQENNSYHGNPNLKPLAYQHDFSQEEIEEYLRKQEALFVERMESSIDDIKAEIENLIENGGDQKEGILSQLSETFNDIYHKMVANLRKLVNK